MIFFDLFAATDFGDSDILNAFNVAFNMLCGLDVPVEEGKKCYIMVRDRPKKSWHTREIKNQSVCLFQPNAIHSVINQLNGWRYVVLFDTVVWFENYPEIVKSCRTTGVWANLD